jgi:large subunit ribosomal protein L10
MPKPEKAEKVAALKERIEGSSALLLTEYRGLTVSEIRELRGSLREAGTSFAVVKNTLMSRAAAEAGIEEIEQLLSGPSAVAFVDGDAVEAAKTIKAAIKQFPALVLKGGYMDGAVLDAAEANSLADLESREVMLSKIAGLLKTEMSRAASMFVAGQSKFMSLLEAYKEKVPGEMPADAPAAEAEDAPAEETQAEAEEATAEEAPAEVPAEAVEAEPIADAAEEVLAEEPTTAEAADDAGDESAADTTDESTEEE